MPNSAYNTFKFMAQIILPVFGALYFILEEILGLPDAWKVLGTILIVDAILGISLSLLSRVYTQSGAKYDGVIDIIDSDNAKMFSLELNSDPNKLEDQSEVLFKVISK